MNRSASLFVPCTSFKGSISISSANAMYNSRGEKLIFTPKTENGTFGLYIGKFDFFVGKS